MAGISELERQDDNIRTAHQEVLTGKKKFLTTEEVISRFTNLLRSHEWPAKQSK